MKYAFFLFVCLGISKFVCAQNSGSEDHIKITLGQDTVHISFKDKSFRLDNIQSLDSCLKKYGPELTLPVADLECSMDLTAQNHRSIVVILDKYRIPLVSEKRLSDGKAHGAVSFMRKDSLYSF